MNFNKEINKTQNSFFNLYTKKIYVDYNEKELENFLINRPTLNEELYKTDSNAFYSNLDKIIKMEEYKIEKHNEKTKNRQEEITKLTLEISEIKNMKHSCGIDDIKATDETRTCLPKDVSNKILNETQKNN